MSIVVAVKKEGRIAIASDSQYSMSSLIVDAKYKVNHHKLYRSGKSWIGLVGWGALDNVFEHLIENEQENLDLFGRAAIFKSLLSVHETLKEKYFLDTDEEDDQPVESNQMDGLIVNQSGMFGFSSYRSVNEYDRFWAIGSGREFALGAMFACYDENLPARKIAEKGVLGAIEFDDGCGLPVQVKTVKC